MTRKKVKKMFNNHTMSIVFDTSLIYDALYMPDIVDIINVGDPYNTSELPMVKSICLAPSVNLMQKWASYGNNGALLAEYPSELFEKMGDITGIIAQLCHKNIILFMTFEEYNVYGRMLENFIINNFGIVPISPYNQQMLIDASRYPMIVSYLYLYGYMTYSGYIDAYPAKYQYPDIVIDKLSAECGLMGTFEDRKNELNRRHAEGMKKVVMVEKVEKLDDNI
jgi:hypothetical protein